jgi:hypothetical protein
MLYRKFVLDGVKQETHKNPTSSSKRQMDDADQYDKRILGSDDFIEGIRTRQESSAGGRQLLQSRRL